MHTIYRSENGLNDRNRSTGIEWTEKSWNPVTGCTKVSPGCKRCYAETQAKRLKAMRVNGYEHGFDTVSLMHSRLTQPLKRKKPTVYFVNSMSDMFHPDVPFDFIDRVMDVIERSPQHTFQMLTKRAERMAEYFANRSVPRNAWIGVSVEDREYGVPRIAVLRSIQAETRFLSVEPLLEDLGAVDLSDMHWVIVGGESGAKARRMHIEWVLNIKDLCEHYDVPFFFKQWGKYSADGVKKSKKTTGRILLGQTWDDMPPLERDRKNSVHLVIATD